MPAGHGVPPDREIYKLIYVQGEEVTFEPEKALSAIWNLKLRAGANSAALWFIYANLHRTAHSSWPPPVEAPLSYEATVAPGPRPLGGRSSPRIEYTDCQTWRLMSEPQLVMIRAQF